MLATLAIACRPHRAPTWDAAGVVAAIAKVRDRSLPDVVLAVIRAAADHEAKTPGVIPSAGNHWAEQLKPQPWQPERIPAAERCSVCSKSRTDCEAKRASQRGMDPTDPRYDDHTFAPDFKPERDTDTAATVQALREIRMTTDRTTTEGDAA